jgi:hypothetical protein
MKAAILVAAVALAGGSSVRLPEEFPLSLGGFEFGDSHYVIRTKCEKKGKLNGKSRYAITEDGTPLCRGVSPGKPYLPWSVTIGFTVEKDRLSTMFIPMPLEEVAKYAREMTRAIGEGAKTSAEGYYCVRYTDQTGSICADMTNRYVAFLAHF